MTKKIKSKHANEARLVNNWGYSKESDYILENIALLVSSGVGISESVSIVSGEIKSSKLKKILSSVINDLDNGLPLWESFQSARLFNENYINLIKVSEESGRLTDNLKVIVSQQQRERTFKSKIRTAMAYPLIVFSLIIIVGLGISWFILPRLTSAFSGLRIKVPLITQILMDFGNFLQNYGYIFVPLTFISVTLIVYFLFINRRTKFIGQAILIKTPIASDIIKQTEIARLGFVLGGLLSSGLSITEALNSLVKTSVYRKYTKLYQHLSEKIEEGYSFKNSLESYKDSAQLIPIPVQQMIVAGEKSGNLPDILARVDHIYEEKVDISTENLAIIIEPVLLVIVFLGVLMVAVAVIIPIYSMIGNVGGG